MLLPAVLRRGRLFVLPDGGASSYSDACSACVQQCAVPAEKAQSHRTISASAFDPTSPGLIYPSYAHLPDPT